MEAAASLFGSDDSASDPFALLGTADVTSPAAHDVFNAPQTVQESPFLPQDSSNNQPVAENDYFSTGSGYVEPTSELYGTTNSNNNAVQAAPWDSYAEVAPAQPQTNNYDTTTTVSSSAYDAYAKQEPAAVNSYSPATNPYAPTTNSYAPATNAYSPAANSYTPATNSYTPATNSYTSAANSYNPAANAYTPATNSYTPAANSYTPAQSTPAQNYSNPAASSYDPYAAPAVQSRTPAVAPPANVPARSSWTKPSAPVAPPAPLNRPKTSNAYDPPFPTTKSTRRTSARVPSQPAYTQYGSYGPTSPGLPPPPANPYIQPPPAPNTYTNAYSQPPIPRQQLTGSPLSLPPRAPSVQEETVADVLAASSTQKAIKQEEFPAEIPTDSVDENDSVPPMKKVEKVDSKPPPLNSASYGMSAYDPPLPSRSSSRASVHATSPNVSSLYNSNIYGPSSRASSRASVTSYHGAETSHETPPSAYSSNGHISPPASSDNDKASEMYDPYQPTSKSVTSPSATSTYDPYAPKTNGHAITRTPSSGSLSLTSPGPHIKSPPPKGPPRVRSMSNSSQMSNKAETLYSPPLQHAKQSISESDYGAYPSSRYNYPSLLEIATAGQGQELIVSNPTIAPYVPSPSLMGSNDPLGRTAARVPVFSFGFGGKFVSCFHGASALETGFDVALSSRKSTGVHIRVLNSIIPDSVLGLSADTYPGPLMSDPGSPGASLIRTGAAQAKAKKGRLIKYLEERVEQISLGVGYLNYGSADQRQADGKLVLIRLLKVMIENDGRLSGTPPIDRAVRAALIPKFAAESSADTGAASSSFSPADSLQTPYANMTTLTTAESTEAPIAVTTLRPSALEKIQDLLLRGERRQAYHYALDQKLWAHAMVIASSIDKDAWKEVVNEFLKGELGAQTQSVNSRPTDVSSVNGRESIRVAYSLYSGQGAASVQEMIPQSFLARGTGPGLLLPAFAHSAGTPMTPGFPAVSQTPIPVESLSKWAETVAMMFASPLSSEASTAITALGDQLMANQWTEAAHVCYLLAPQTSPLGGLGNPSARIVLLGSRSPQVMPNFHTDPDSMILTEILEYALSLVPVAKGQDSFGGLPHLQAYRLIRASALAEVGYVSLATRYCDAIVSSASRPSPYFNVAFTEQLKGLADRIIAAPHLDKSGSWIGGKMTKPSLDTIGDWLGGRITKLITGDGDSDAPAEEEVTGHEETTFAGPFGQYSTISTISSAAPSTSSSPQPSTVNLNVLPPRRTGSAAGHSGPPTVNAYTPIDRASSAMDYARKKPSSPNPRVYSANPSTTTFAQAHPPSTVPYGLALNPYSPYNNNFDDAQTPRPAPEKTEEDETGQEVTWWGAGDSSSTQTPTAATFLQVDQNTAAPSADGFISLMDAQAYTVAPRTNGGSRLKNQQNIEEDDEEDLGFGNSRRATPANADADEGRQSKEYTPVAPKREESAPAPDPKQTAPVAAAGGGWFGRFWKKSDAAPGPIKASLGEEQSFYYDKDLKRWINKKAGDTAAKPATPPPPPSRSQTVSPGSSRPNPPPSPGPPARRAMSAANLNGTAPPGKPPMRVRSNLVPTAGTESAPGTPTGINSMVPPGAPPPGRPKSQAGKRNIRSRYVDVLREE